MALLLLSLFTRNLVEKAEQLLVTFADDSNPKLEKSTMTELE